MIALVRVSCQHCGLPGARGRFDLRTPGDVVHAARLPTLVKAAAARWFGAGADPKSCTRLTNGLLEQGAMGKEGMLWPFV